MPEENLKLTPKNVFRIEHHLMEGGLEDELMDAQGVRYVNEAIANISNMDRSGVSPSNYLFADSQAEKDRIVMEMILRQQFFRVIEADEGMGDDLYELVQDPEQIRQVLDLYVARQEAQAEEFGGIDVLEGIIDQEVSRLGGDVSDLL